MQDSCSSKPNALRTRQVVSCPIFGNPSEFSEKQLPTFSDVMKCFNQERWKLKETCNKDPAVGEVAVIVAKKLVSIYAIASIPTLSWKRIIDMIKSYHAKHRNLMKNYKTKKESVSFKEKVELFKRDSCRLFDISSCKCEDFQLCSCEKAFKIPILERDFIVDQRTERNMVIGGIDAQTTHSLTLKQQRKQALETTKPDNAPDTVEICDYTSPSSDEASSDTEYIPTFKKQRKEGHQKVRNTSIQKRTLSNLAQACDRTGVSDRAAALISTSVLQDYGIVTEGVRSDVIDRSQIRRSRSLVRKETKKATVTNTIAIKGIYFDGRKDQTLINEKKGSNYHMKTISEEHIALITEPDSMYLGHFGVDRGTAQNIANGIIRLLDENSISSDSLTAVGCDGTAVNTGPKGGAIRILEGKLGRPLHWFICQLHANELPLRHLIQELDGKTTGPRGFTGDIGKKLHDCEKLPINVFAKINLDMCLLDEKIVNDLSTDQKYLYDISTAVGSGQVSESVAARQPGKMSHSRWLTTASRILRLYVSTSKPSDTLIDLATFVMKLYVPMWFTIKSNCLAVDGAKNVHKTLVMFNKLPEAIQKIIKPVIQRNSFFVHPENIIITMLQDDRDHIRELGWRRIKRARRIEREQIRQFRIPKLNFSSDDYTNMIDWNESDLTEPPLTAQYSDEFIDIQIKEKGKLNIERYPCHTQAVERMIKLVTEASLSVCGEKSRDGFIRTKLASRAKIPKFETKRQYAL